jgi:hypothetical protein
MSAGKSLLLGIKVLVLAVAYTVIFIIGTMVSGMSRQAASTPGATATAPPPPADQNTVLLMLFIASLIQVIALAYLVLQAQWTGWKVTGALFLVFLNTWLQAAIESVVYLQGKVPAQFNFQMPIVGLVIGLLFSPLAVWLLGGFKQKAAEVPQVDRARLSPGEFAGKVAAAGVVFVAVYFLCGYFIAWQNPALRQFYQGSTELKSFWVHMAAVWSGTPWMIPYQTARGLLWVAMTLPALWMLRGGRARVALGGALMYAALGGSVILILPNPLMPPSIAHSHLIETAVFGLVLGAFVGWMMARREAAPPAEVAQVPKAA